MKLPPLLPCPPLVHVRQELPTEKIADVRRLLADQLSAAKLRISKGGKIAITAGSRGFGGLLEVVQGLVEFVRASGGVPMVIPAMGSHGGATAEGQKRLLEGLGLGEKIIGAEIHATMETICLGTSRTGAKAHLDKIAADCEGIIVFGRVKTHPENAEGIASGLLKMTTVGLGKQIGAQEAHTNGLWESIRAVPELTLGTGKILCGVALVENCYRQPVALEVVPGNCEAFREADERLLLVSKKHFARVPFDSLDVLIVDEMGKNISGTGLDPNVIGTWRIKGGERRPDYKRITVLSLTPESQGNGLGVGLADFTTRRFERAYDPAPTLINLLTATEPGTRNTVEAMIPTILENDREAIETAIYSSKAKTPRVCRIKNTAELADLWLSEWLLDEAKASSSFEICGGPEPLRYNAQGDLF